MRIVELVNNLEIGGTERLVVDLATALKAKGHYLSVICLRGGGPLQGVLEQAGMEVVLLDKPEGPTLRVLQQLISYLKKNEIDVVHTHNPLVHHYGVVAGRLAGVPVIVNTIHGPGNLAAKSGLKELLYGVMCRWSDRVIAVCPTAFQVFRQRSIIPRSKLITINNGIPLDVFLKVTPRATDANFVFGIVGRLATVKDHRTLLEAFSIVIQARPECRLEILGDGILRGDLERHAHALGLADNVIFHGYSADVPAFMERINVSILCSLSEGLPLSVLEAMASGIPVVGTDVGETRDLIQAARSGWFCPPKCPDKLAEAMLHAVTSRFEDRLAMGARARAFVVENYSLNRMIDNYERQFDQLLRAREFSSNRLS